MSWLLSLLPRGLVTFFLGDQTDPSSLREAVLANLRANKGVSSPHLVAMDLGADVSIVEASFRLLVTEKKISRLGDERQIVKPGKDEGIPSPYVRYELVVNVPDLLAALQSVVSATVPELTKLLGVEAVRIDHLIHEALDHGQISVAHDRHDAYSLPRR